MKCRFCGAKIGILERWRFGDFCSKEHKDDFADDLVKLNEQIVQDLRRIPTLYKSGAGAAAAAGEPQPVEQPDPPEAIFLLEADPDPVVEQEQPKLPDDASGQRSKTEQWRLFSKMADWEGLPATAVAASKEKEKEQSQSFLWVQLDHQSELGPQGILLAGSFPAILPSRRLRRTQGHMPMSPVWLPPDPRQTAADDARRYAIGGTIQQWVENHAWGWMTQDEAASMPDLEPVLAAYPLTAPWTGWTIVPPSRQQPMQMGAPQSMAPHSMASMMGQPLQLAGMPTPGMQPGASNYQSVPDGALFQRTPGNGIIQPPSSGALLHSPLTGSGPAMGGAPILHTPAGVASGPMAPNSYAAAPGAGSYAVMPPGSLPVWSAAPGVNAVPGIAAPQGFAYPAPRLMSSGITWRELPPPLFSALIDLWSLQKPVALASAPLVPEYASLRPTLIIASAMPRLGAAALPCGMPFVDCQGDPAEDLMPADTRKARPRSHARTLWRRHLLLPKAYGTVGQPKVPAQPGPAFVFSIRRSLAAPEARPQLQIGRWRT